MRTPSPLVPSLRFIFTLSAVTALCACVSGPRDARPAPDPAPESAPTASPTPAPPPVDPALVTKADAVLDASLASTDEEEAAEALVALGLAGRADARKKLEAALTSPDGRLRFSAARGLRHLGDAGVEEVLADAWKKERGWAVQKELAIAAGAVGAKALVPLLTLALAHPNEQLVHAAAWALEALGDPAGTAKLEALGRPEPTWAHKPGTDKWARRVLSGEREGDRALAARILAERGTPEDVPLAARSLEDPAPGVGLYAAALVLRWR